MISKPADLPFREPSNQPKIVLDRQIASSFGNGYFEGASGKNNSEKSSPAKSFNRLGIRL
jgi:hypothetical protein